MPRFVILRHETPAGYERASHYDLMLEMGDSLRTWALAELPVPGRELVVEALSNHRLMYLDYEGPISGNRGVVTRVERGEFEVLEASAEVVVVQLSGLQLCGRLTLRKDVGAGESWKLSLELV